MRAWVLLATSLAIPQLSSAGAQTSAPLPPAPDEIVRMSREAFQNAHTPDAIESVKEWCEDALSTFSLKERVQLMATFESSARDNKFEEMNAAIKRLHELEDLDKSHGETECQPDSKGNAIRRSQTKTIGGRASRIGDR
jgi:hypothetical protein